MLWTGRSAAVVHRGRPVLVDEVHIVAEP